MKGMFSLLIRGNLRSFKTGVKGPKIKYVRKKADFTNDILLHFSNA